LVDSVEGTKIL